MDLLSKINGIRGSCWLAVNPPMGSKGLAVSRVCPNLPQVLLACTNRVGYHHPLKKLDAMLDES